MLNTSFLVLTATIIHRQVTATNLEDETRFLAVELLVTLAGTNCTANAVVHCVV